MPVRFLPMFMRRKVSSRDRVVRFSVWIFRILFLMCTSSPTSMNRSLVVVRERLTVRMERFWCELNFKLLLTMSCACSEIFSSESVW